MPAIGATANGDDSSILRIFTGVPKVQSSKVQGSWASRFLRAAPCTLPSVSSRPHIRRIHLYADALPDQIHRQHQARLRSLPRQAPDDALERPVRDLDERACLDRRARVEWQRAL